MKSFTEMQYHPLSEKLVNILCERTQNNNPQFFRLHVAYYFSVVAAMMRCQVSTMDRGKLPVNMYAINLATSGAGKGHSTNIMEETILGSFFDRYLGETFPATCEVILNQLALDRATKKGSDFDEELERTKKEFNSLGPIVLGFDSGTVPAIKQARHKLLMVNAGSLNLQIDEIGTNLSSNLELFGTFLELYDVGRLKPKLIKNTAENIRNEEVGGRTPANMMLFGTPSRLLDGGKTEEDFYSLLDTGFARRCFYGFSQKHTRDTDITPADMLRRRMDVQANNFLSDTSLQMQLLASPHLMNKELPVSEEVTLLFIEYQLQCEKLADSLPDHTEMRKSEISHRYFKAIKLAGAYAFIDGAHEVKEEHAYYAIKLAEESGKAFESVLARDRPYVKLAKYIAQIGSDITQADLVEDLPFYSGSASAKNDMMQLAISYGYKNNIIIKKSYDQGIEFLRGETLKVTDLSKLRVSYSYDVAYNYSNEEAPWDELTKLTQEQGLHWCNHHFTDGHREDGKAIPGFNLIVLDIDDPGLSIALAKNLLKGHKALYYTTKRSTEEHERFRIILPTNYELALDGDDFKEFMKNIYEWLPFEGDTQSGQRARKWLSHNGYCEYVEGDLFNVLPFIPKTSKNEERKRKLIDLSQMDNLERWVINNSGDGNRNNMLLRFALILVDAGLDFNSVLRKVKDLNEKLSDQLSEAEILGTIMVTVGKQLSKV